MISELLAPIVIFAYNRPDHLHKTLEALSNNLFADLSRLIIFCDGPKDNCSIEEREKINQVRKIAKLKKWCGLVEIYELEKNKGLSNSIIDGVTKIVNDYSKIIVLEDDIVPSIGFLKYMNEALNMYENENQVGCIHAWNYSFPKNNKKESTFFLKGGDCWGWATWKRGWNLFNSKGEELINEIKSKKLEYSFNRNGTIDFMAMLQNQINGLNDSWAIRWHASLFVHEKFCLHPVTPIVQNIGLDNSGTHCKDLEIVQNSVDFIELNKIHVEDSQWFYINYAKLINRNLLPEKSINIRKKLKHGLKLIIPPLFFKLYSKFQILENSKDVTSAPILSNWEGEFFTWKDATEYATGYDSSYILDQCRKALIKVKLGEAIFERDSVIFESIQYNWPLISGIAKARIENGKKLNVIDFGGSLGSLYYSLIKFFDSKEIERWSIIEQENFVECGRKDFEDETLRFYENIESCINENDPNLVILSSVLQYIENPYELLSNLFSLNVEYILIDRTAFINRNEDCISNQVVPSYQAKIQHWFFSFPKFQRLVKSYNWEVIVNEKSYIQFNNISLNSQSKFLILKKK
jgi:putative methyltransferase (TIGR04325 family)